MSMKRSLDIYIEIKTTKDMKSRELLPYTSPEVDILEIYVEGCLAASLEDPSEKPEIDW